MIKHDLEELGSRHVSFGTEGPLRYIISQDPLQRPGLIIGGDDGYRWHLSMSCENRYPTWDEQRDLRYKVMAHVPYMVQVMPPRSEYVNVHSNTFHWHEFRDGDRVSDLP